MEIELQSLIANKNGQMSCYNNESNISQEEDSYCKPKNISNFAIKASWINHK